MLYTKRPPYFSSINWLHFFTNYDDKNCFGGSSSYSEPLISTIIAEYDLFSSPWLMYLWASSFMTVSSEDFVYCVTSNNYNASYEHNDFSLSTVIMLGLGAKFSMINFGMQNPPPPNTKILFPFLVFSPSFMNLTNPVTTCWQYPLSR